MLTFQSEELDADRCVAVTGDRARHMVQVQGVRAGTVLRVGELNGGLGSAEVVHADIERVLARVGALEVAVKRPQVDLILALPRPQMLKHVLQTVAMMGVDRLMLIRSRRVTKSYFDSPVLSEEKQEHYLRLGLEQAVVTAMPRVTVHSRFRRFLEEEFVACPASESDSSGDKKFGETHLLLAHPKAAKGLPEMRLEATLTTEDRLLLAIGPEGGWDDFEVESFMKKGFELFHCGPRILRVEQAVCALLSQLQYVQSLAANNG